MTILYSGYYMNTIRFKDNEVTANQKAYVRITKEPAQYGARFRFRIEPRYLELVGEDSTNDNKTFPSIEIVGHKGRAMVVVSCVTEDPPYRPHSNNIVGRKGFENGILCMEIDPETMSVTFRNLGIYIMMQGEVEPELQNRERIGVDPFKTGFSRREFKLGDLQSIRICFQVFLEDPERMGQFTIPLAPVVSNPIYNGSKKQHMKRKN